MVASVVDANNYTITVPVTANSSDAGSNKGGSSVIRVLSNTSRIR